MHQCMLCLHRGLCTSSVKHHVYLYLVLDHLLYLLTNTACVCAGRLQKGPPKSEETSS